MSGGGPYERIVDSTGLRVLSGSINLDGGGRHVRAQVLGGECFIELVDTCDDVVTAFGTDQPIHRITPRRKLRLTVEADLDQLVVTVEPNVPPGGGGGGS